MNEKSRQRFRAQRTGIGAPLGELETAIMRCVWNCGEAGCLAMEIQQTLEAEKTTALTTILTTMDRLRKKGIILREREGKAYQFRAAVTEQELEQRIVGGVLDNLIARFPEAVAIYFAQAEPDEAKLAEMARRIAAIQNQQKEGTEGTDG